LKNLSFEKGEDKVTLKFVDFFNFYDDVKIIIYVFSDSI